MRLLSFFTFGHLAGYEITLLVFLVLQVPITTPESSKTEEIKIKVNKKCSSSFSSTVPELIVHYQNPSVSVQINEHETGETVEVSCQAGAFLTLAGVLQNSNEKKAIQCQANGSWAPKPDCHRFSRFEKCHAKVSDKYLIYESSEIGNDIIPVVQCKDPTTGFVDGHQFAFLKCSDDGVLSRSEGGPLECRTLKACDKEDVKKAIAGPEDRLSDIVIGNVTTYVGDERHFETELNCANGKTFKSKHKSLKMICYDGNWTSSDRADDGKECVDFCPTENLKKDLENRNLDIAEFLQKGIGIERENRTFRCIKRYTFKSTDMDGEMNCENKTWSWVNAKKPECIVDTALVRACELMDPKLKLLDEIGDTVAPLAVPRYDTKFYPEGKYLVQCALPGYDLDGTENVSCEKTIWTPALPKCSQKVCPTDGIEVKNGKLESYDKHTGTAVVKCDDGFVIQASMKKTNSETALKPEKLAPGKATSSSHSFLASQQNSYPEIATNQGNRAPGQESPYLLPLKAPVGNLDRILIDSEPEPGRGDTFYNYPQSTYDGADSSGGVQFLQFSGSGRYLRNVKHTIPGQTGPSSGTRDPTTSAATPAAPMVTSENVTCINGEWSKKKLDCELPFTCAPWAGYDKNLEKLLNFTDGLEAEPIKSAGEDRYAMGSYKLACLNETAHKVMYDSKIVCGMKEGVWAFVSENKAMPLCEVFCTVPIMPHAIISHTTAKGQYSEKSANSTTVIFPDQSAKLTCFPGFRVSYKLQKHDQELVCIKERKHKQGVAEKNNRAGYTASLQDIKECKIMTGCPKPRFDKSVAAVMADHSGRERYGDRYDFDKTINGQCGDHYHLKLENDVFAVTCKEAETNDTFEWEMNLEKQLKCTLDQCALFKVNNGKLQVMKDGLPVDLDPGEKMINHGKSVFVKCNDGFTLSRAESETVGGVAKISCNGTSWAKSIPACVSTGCPEYVLPNGRMEAKSSEDAVDVSGNSKNTLSIYAYCDEGFELWGGWRITCEKGAWTSSAEGFPSCNPAECQWFPVPNGYLVDSGGNTSMTQLESAGTYVTAKCDAEFKATSGETEIQCMQSILQPRHSYWSGAAPACLSTKCGKYNLARGHLEKVDTSSSGGGSIKLLDKDFPVDNGTKVNAVCDSPDVEVTGGLQMECVEGAWIPDGDGFPSCSGVKGCLAPHVPNGDFEDGDELESSFEIDSEVYLRCKDNFRPIPKVEGSNRVKFKCNGDGTWAKEGGFKYCRSTSCSAFSVPNGALDDNPELLHPNGMYKAEAVVNVTCKRGYISETNWVQCDGETQKWKGLIPSCSRVPSVTQIGHGTVEKALISGKEGVEAVVDPERRPKIVCDSGFRLQGSDHLKLNKEIRNWEPVSGGAHPYCEAIENVAWALLFFIVLMLDLIVVAWYVYAKQKKREKFEFFRKSTPWYRDDGEKGQKPPTPSAPEADAKDAADAKGPGPQNAETKNGPEVQSSPKTGGQAAGNVKPVEVERGTSAPRSLLRKRDKKGDQKDDEEEYEKVRPQPKKGEAPKSTPEAAGEGGPVPANPVDPPKSSPKEGGPKPPSKEPAERPSARLTTTLSGRSNR